MRRVGSRQNVDLGSQGFSRGVAHAIAVRRPLKFLSSEGWTRTDSPHGALTCLAVSAGRWLGAQLVLPNAMSPVSLGLLRMTAGF